MRLDINRLRDALNRHFPSRVMTVDSHTAGEATRLIVGGVESVPGDTMPEKLRFYQENLDHIRLLLTREPRGHRELLAAHVTKPVRPDARFGLIYMDARRYPYLCGHATIGAVTTLIEAGVIPVTAPEMTVKVDTPSGPMITTARVRHGMVESVTIRMVPAFVYATGQVINVPEARPISVDLVCSGGFFAMVSAEQTGLELIPENSTQLAALGMAIIDAANAQLTVAHPTRPEVKTVDVTEFYSPPAGANQGKSVVVYGESHVDRSPCGTGTTAKMALLHHRNLLDVGESHVNISPLGTAFEGRIVSETRVGDLEAVEVEIRGSAYVTGIHEFIIAPRDPFPEGFLL